MISDSSLFGLRFGLNTDLQPTQEELELFLQSKIKKNGTALTAYNRVLEDVMSYQSRQQQEAPPRNVREKMFSGALSHSCFFNPALKSAVEQYLYQLHALLSLDFKKPEAFINAAAEAIRNLDPKKKADAAKLAKIQDMADERKKLLVTLNSRRAAFVDELNNITRYIRDNLVKIGARCETSIVVLVDNQLARTEETRLIEDIKTHFREKLKNDLRDCLITRQHLETAKKDVALISREISNILRENVFALTRLFESIYDHVTKITGEINALLAENQSNKNKSFKKDVELFTQIEQALVRLLSGARFELKAPEMQTETPHIGILMEKSKEMFDHLCELMQKERRSWMRRYHENRRSDELQKYKDPKRRSGNDRRAADDRRKFAGSFL